MRSFSSPETATEQFFDSPAPLEVDAVVLSNFVEKIQNQVLRLFETYTNSVFEVIKNIPNPFSSEIKTWSSERYIEKGNIDEFITDLLSYLDEYAALMPVITYQYGVNGMQNGYNESMSDIAARFVESLETKGMSAARAEMEHQVALTVEQWMSDPSIPVGARLLWVSPRGSRNEGYPGLHKKNYIFINTAEKLADGFQLRQYRSYELNHQLPALQQQLLSQFSATPYWATPEQPKRQDLQTINTLLQLGPEVELHQLEALIYQNKQDWKVDIDNDLPQIDSEEYFAEVAKISALCVQTLESLVLAKTDTQQATQQLDTLIKVVKDALVKWVETHAKNYPQENVEPYQVDEDELEQVWQAKLAKEDGKRLDNEQKSILKHFSTVTKLNPHLPLKGLMSWSHCIAGTPFSMSTNVLKVNQLPLSANGLGGAALEMRLANLSETEKNSLAEELSQLVRITVHGEVWHVPADYLEEPGCYWDEEQQIVMGPCGIPLSQDPYARTDYEYQLLMSQLLKQDFVNDPELDTQQKISAIHLFSLLENKLFKSSIGIDSWINNSISVTETASLGPTLRQLHQRIEDSINPLLYLHSYVRDLIVNDESEMIETLTTECEQNSAEITLEIPLEVSGKAFAFPQPGQSMAVAG